MCRNFGTTRNTLVAPYKAGTTTDSSLEIEKLSGQTGDLIKADDSAGADLFRVEADGAVLLGDGLAGATGTAKFDKTSLEIGNQDLTSGDKHNQYGAVLQVAGSNRGYASLQGSQASADGDVAIRVDKGQSDGSLTSSLSLTYGGAMTLTSLTATGTVTSGGFSTTAASSLGNVTLVDGSEFTIGSGKIKITNDKIENATYIVMGPGAGTASGTGLSYSDGTDVSGALFMNTSQLFLGKGGDGSGGLAYGGQGSTVFTYGGASRTGPRVGVTSNAIVLGGWMVPEAQGGVTGEDGTNPAYAYYSGSIGDYANTVAWASVPEAAIPAKKQITQGITAATDAVTVLNKYEKIGSITSTNSGVLDVLQRADNVDWAERYSQIEIHLHDVKITENSRGFMFGINQTTDGFSGTVTNLTNTGGSGQNWTAMVGNSPYFIASATGNTYGGVVPGSMLVHNYNSSNDSTLRGQITLNLSPTLISTHFDFYHNTITTSVSDFHASVSCDTANHKLYQLVFGRRRYNNNTYGGIQGGSIEVYGIKR